MPKAPFLATDLFINSEVASSDIMAMVAMLAGLLIMVTLISVGRNGALVTMTRTPPGEVKVGGVQVAVRDDRGATTTTNFIE